LQNGQIFGRQPPNIALKNDKGASWKFVKFAHLKKRKNIITLTAKLPQWETTSVLAAQWRLVYSQ